MPAKRRVLQIADTASLHCPIPTQMSNRLPGAIDAFPLKIHVVWCTR